MYFYLALGCWFFLSFSFHLCVQRVLWTLFAKFKYDWQISCMGLEGMRKLLLQNILSHKDNFTQKITSEICFCLCFSQYYLYCSASTMGNMICMQYLINIRFTTSLDDIPSPFSPRENQHSEKSCSFVCSFTQSCVHSFTQSFVYSFTQSLIKSAITIWTMLRCCL